MEQHYDDVKYFFRHGKSKDSYARHFLKHFKKKPSNEDIRKISTHRVLHRVSPFSFCKKAQSYDCSLCMMEKHFLVKRRLDKEKPMNDNSEIYGTCRHRPKFHRFHDTDERGKREKDSKRINKTVSSPSKRRRTILVVEPNLQYGRLITKRKEGRSKLSKTAKRLRQRDSWQIGALQPIAENGVQSNLDYPDLDFPDFSIIRNFSPVPFFS